MNILFRLFHAFWAAFCIAAVVVATLAIFTGCDKDQSARTGEIPPEISGTDIHDEYISLKQLKGKVVILYFWTNSCCGDKLKLLEPYYIHNKDNGLAILAINVGNSRETVESYAKNNSVTFTLHCDEHSMTSRQYGVFGFPTIFIIDREGVLRKKIVGAIEPSQLDTYVRNYLTK